MTAWSELTPQLVEPKTVATARAKVEALKARVPAHREALEAAKADVVTAEQADRERMAEQLARGGEAEPDDDAVSKARERVAGQQRASEALNLAVATAETALRDAVLAARHTWQRAAQRDFDKAREQARRSLAEFEAGLAAMRDSRAVVAWLRREGGFDRQQQPRAGSLGRSPSSARWAANAQEVDALTLLSWCAEVVEPALPADPPAVQPLQPVAR